MWHLAASRKKEACTNYLPVTPLSVAQSLGRKSSRKKNAGVSEQHKRELLSILDTSRFLLLLRLLLSYFLKEE